MCEVSISRSVSQTTKHRNNLSIRVCLSVHVSSTIMTTTTHDTTVTITTPDTEEENGEMETIVGGRLYNYHVLEDPDYDRFNFFIACNFFPRSRRMAQEVAVKYRVR